MSDIHVSDDPGAVAGRILVDALQAAVDARGRASLAVPGGGSPVPVFRWLAAHLPHDLARVLTLTWVDERHVPHPGDAWTGWPDDSNRRLAWEHWLQHAAVRPTEVPMAPVGDLEASREAFEAAFVDRIGTLDAVLLGAGGDGHIASLFPGHPGLDVTDRACLAVDDSPKPPPERLSLTLPTLAAADCRVLIATGAGKGAMLGRVRAGADLPIGRLGHLAPVTWVLDPAAAEAAGLSSSDVETDR